MQSLRWIDRTQPQSLMTATIVMYVNAVYGVIFSLQSAHFPWGVALVVGPVIAGLGIANEKKWGYWFAVALSAFAVAITIHFFSFGAIVNLLFWVALLA